MGYLLTRQFLHIIAKFCFPTSPQISDFGMSRDVEDENYYVSSGGKVPVKWAAPEVHNYTLHARSTASCCIKLIFNRPSTTRSTPLPVMCGALAVSCMKYGVWDTNLSRCTLTLRLILLLYLRC